MSNLQDVCTNTDQDLEEQLKGYFGYNTFRPFQKEIIQALLKKEDVLAILPTGAGKSLCYQLPAMLMPGTAIVISPLISLMQDQVVSLYKNGISAAFINSSLPSHEIRSVLQNMGDYKLLYVAPERFADLDFIERLKGTSLSFFVIDEAHCISQWGHSFRVEYRKLGLLKEIFPSCPVIALTATATSDVEKDIQTQLAMDHPILIKGSFDRPNLTIRVHAKSHSEEQLQTFLKEQGNRSGIIYASTRKGVDSAFNLLQREGYSVGRYHAGMSEQDRSAAQHAFLHDQTTLMVATVAFGMGVHKPDIRFIIHMDMPRTIEQYYQEIGRAGRDGLPADCLMLYGAQDLVIYKSFLEQVEDLLVRQEMKNKIERMYRLCTSLKCRRQVLLNYFGETFPQEKCGACDNCLEESEQIEGTALAQKILSCVYRLKQNFGMRMVIDVLRGSKSQLILKRGFDQHSTYGILKELSEQEVRYYIESLLHLGLLCLTEGEYPVLKWTPLTQGAVYGKETVFFKKRIFKAPKEAQLSYKPREVASLHYDEVLFQALRQLRSDIAREEEVPPFVVFSDRALQEMAVYYPQTKEDFGKINGVGPIKWVKYGERFLQAILAHGITQPIPKREFTELRRESLEAKPQRMQSREMTISLFKEGRTVEQIMEDRQLARSTILSHLVEAIQHGVDLDLSLFLSKEKEEAIKQVILEVGAERLTPIKEKLSPDYSFDEIRLVAAFHQRKN